MRDEGNVVIGFLGKCDFDLGIAVVNVTTFLDVQVVLLNHHMVFLPYSSCWPWHIWQINGHKWDADP